jgi:hypothetical protein
MSNISVGISTGGVSEVFDTNSKTGWGFHNIYVLFFDGLDLV